MATLDTAVLDPKSTAMIVLDVVQRYSGRWFQI